MDTKLLQGWRALRSFCLMAAVSNIAMQADQSNSMQAARERDIKQPKL